MKKAIIAMSGGVDFSVAAYLTKRQDYSCIGRKSIVEIRTPFVVK